MSTGDADDPLVRLSALPGVAGVVDAARAGVDGAYGHRVMRRRAPSVAAEAALRGARASAALAGADWALEEVRRRSDFSGGDSGGCGDNGGGDGCGCGDGGALTVGAALRLTAEAGRSAGVWRSSPLQVLARLHLLAAGGPGTAGAGAEAVGRPRRADEEPDEPRLARLGPAPDAREVAARLDALARLVIAGSTAPALVMAAVVHGELLALRPFGSHNGLVARAAERIALTGGGLDPKGVAPAEVGHANEGPDAYLAALARYASGRLEGVAEWIAWCGRAVELGARESVAVCEALQRGAA